MTRKWLFALDRGGTFTDIIGLAPNGQVHTRKLLSVSDAYEDAGIQGIRDILGLAPGEPLPGDVVDTVRIGTTIATNALLERKGVPTALCITHGLEGLLEIGNATRPELFSLAITKPAPLYDRIIGIEEESGADGREIIPLNIEQAEHALQLLKEEGIEHVAIVFKHAWRNPQHEIAMMEIAEKNGFAHITASHKVMPLINMLKRGQTTLIEAYLNPILAGYINTLHRLAGPVELELMQSSGGLAPSRSIHAKDTILSGPAGGVTGLETISRSLGLEQTIGFDMGGTSTDVSRYGGHTEHLFESNVAGVPFHIDMLDIETVAAGGGSILSFDGMRMQAGPESAGSLPGPACYGLGGPLTVTDANLLLGRIVPEFMPRAFGPDHMSSLDTDAARKLFNKRTDEINQASGTRYTPEEVAAGYLRIANEIMCRAIKKISISRGFDIRQHALVCFGGAASQHACDIARLLGIGTIVIHPYSSIFSAWGISVADRVERAAQPLMEKLSPGLLQDLESEIQSMMPPLLELMPATNTSSITTTVFLDLRVQGTDTWLSLPAGSADNSKAPGILAMETITKEFARAHIGRFGFMPETTELEVVNLRLEVRARSPRIEQAAEPQHRPPEAKPEAWGETDTWVEGCRKRIPLYRQEQLLEHDTIEGPAMVAGPLLTLFVQDGFHCSVRQQGVLILEDLATSTTVGATETTENRESQAPDPIMLEVFNNLFMNIAEQMGHTLENTAHSVNMKERHDFSCALFDQNGQLIAHAPHIPVHLGAMDATVSHLINKRKEKMQPGDVYMANDPYEGGSHLPDITVVTPVFLDEATPSFYLANRGHHADIGGSTPGSMPPSSTRIEEEGIVISGFQLVQGGRFLEQETRELLSSGSWPARNPEERISDLKAQIAANNKGFTELKQLVAAWGKPQVYRYMAFIRQNARMAVDRLLRKLAGKDAHFHAEWHDSMDNGAPVAVAIDITVNEHNQPAVTFDFTGTAPQDPSNINAPYAVTRAAVLYCLRTMIDEEIPLNAGCMEPVSIIIPRKSMLAPERGAAVAVGNVETSQRLVDILLAAFGRAAASQGTMNNVLFGNPDNSGSQYYETIPGGSGAIEGAPGASGVQVHMTNTRITDPEILEQRFSQVRITRFRIREDSGGSGRWQGGNGTERSFSFEAPMTVSVLSERRETSPFGLAGGSDGMPGSNRLTKKDGSTLELGHKARCKVEQGDRLDILTPGGGGYGLL